MDALGNPTSFALTPGRMHDLERADQLLPDMHAEIVIADKGYDAEGRVIDPLIKRGKIPAIPSKNNRREPRSYD